jgi:tetratricopeptide (TPR) repeat protein
VFHIATWRERLRNALSEEAAGRPHVAQPGNVDEINDAELPNGIGTPLSDAAARSDHLLGEIIELYGTLGDRPFEWFRNNTTAEAILGNSYMHARVHIYEYLRDNGELDAANALFEKAEPELRAIDAPKPQLGTATYNLACARANQGRLDEAIELLGQAFEMRPEMRQFVANDPDLVSLREDPRFQELVKS